jgi:prepilin-type N-terminal cleavage/methylation domain-containing protein
MEGEICSSERLKRPCRKGFTLLELLVEMAVFAVIMTIGISVVLKEVHDYAVFQSLEREKTAFLSSYYSLRPFCKPLSAEKNQITFSCMGNCTYSFSSDGEKVEGRGDCPYLSKDSFRVKGVEFKDYGSFAAAVVDGREYYYAKK